MNSNKGKILYAASSMEHINNFHLDYIRAIRERGYEVFVMARGEEADFDVPFEKKLFSKKNREARLQITEIIKSESFSAVILNTTLAAFHIRFALPKKNRPKIINIVHGYLFSSKINRTRSALLFFCEWLMRKRTDCVITMNKSDFAVAKKYKLGTEILFSRGMGVAFRNTITEPDNLRREFFREGSFVMCFVGELSRRKNQEFLIRAMKKVKTEIPNAVLCLVGDGAERDRLMLLVKELGVSESVIFTGWRRDACDFIRACDVYVSASSIEGMPFNIIEALAAEKTVLATRVKGHTDLIDDGGDGYLYEYGDIGDFVNKTCQIYYNANLDPKVIKSKYYKYEKNSVFSETLEIILKSIES